MKLLSVSTRVSGSNGELVPIAGQIRLDSGEGFEIFLETSGELENQLSRTANPWIAAMLPYALSKGERIICDIAVDPQLEAHAGANATVAHTLVCPSSTSARLNRPNGAGSEA